MQKTKLMGVGDEAGDALESQIAGTMELGWTALEGRTILMQGYAKGNLHDIPEPVFDLLHRKLDLAGVSVHCFASTIMNWSRKVDEPFEPTIAEVTRAIPRMQRLGTKFVRIMSFKPDDHEFKIPAEVFRRVKEVTARFVDAGLQPLQENCMNYGGMSWQHSLDLLEKCPGLKLLFDTGNPLTNPDRSKARPWAPQDPWEFWVNTRDFVEHIHVKDVICEGESNPHYDWPGQGQARLRDILSDAMKRNYAGGLSIEPHMIKVFHDQAEPAFAAGSSSQDAEKRRNFVSYGRRLEDLLEEIGASLRLVKEC